MRAIMAVAAAVGVFSVLAAGTPARADEGDFDEGWQQSEWQRQDLREHQWRERQRQEQHWREHERWERARRAYAPPPVAYAPPVYYAAPPAYYAPVPTYYQPAPPTYYAPPQRPVFEAPGVSIGFSFR